MADRDDPEVDVDYITQILFIRSGVTSFLQYDDAEKDGWDDPVCSMLNNKTDSFLVANRELFFASI